MLEPRVSFGSLTSDRGSDPTLDAGAAGDRERDLPCDRSLRSFSLSPVATSTMENRRRPLVADVSLPLPLRSATVMPCTS